MNIESEITSEIGKVYNPVKALDRIQICWLLLYLLIKYFRHIRPSSGLKGA